MGPASPRISKTTLDAQPRWPLQGGPKAVARARSGRAEYRRRSARTRRVEALPAVHDNSFVVCRTGEDQASEPAGPVVIGIACCNEDAGIGAFRAPFMEVRQLPGNSIPTGSARAQARHSGLSRRSPSLALRVGVNNVARTESATSRLALRVRVGSRRRYSISRVLPQQRARIMPSALSQVSSYSWRGSDWATMPPPTGACHQPRPAVIVRMRMLKSSDPSKPR
jgi:hypothetical protein